MKKIIQFVVTVLLIATMLPVCCFAKSAPIDMAEIIYLNDGSYITVELVQTETRVSGTKTGSKTYTHYSNSGNENWRAVLRGTFSYTGSSATCTAASCDVTITDTDWYVVAKSATKSGNSAIGELAMGRKFLGITVDKETIGMQLSCDANGNLS